MYAFFQQLSGTSLTRQYGMHPDLGEQIDHSFCPRGGGAAFFF